MSALALLILANKVITTSALVWIVLHIGHRIIAAHEQSTINHRRTYQ